MDNDNTGTLIKKVRQWASDRNLILGSDPGSQALKMVEELGETYSAIARLPAARAAGDTAREAELNDKIEDGFGDAMVVLIIQAAQCGLDLERCLERAWHEIKDRTGTMQGGVFVKDEA